MLLQRRQEKVLWLLESNKKSFQQSLNIKEKSFTVTRKLSTQAQPPPPLVFIYKASQSVRNFKMISSELWDSRMVGIILKKKNQSPVCAAYYTVMGIGPSTRVWPIRGHTTRIFTFFFLSCSYYCLSCQLEMHFSVANTLSTCSSKRVAPQYICCFRVHTLQMWRES